MRLILIGMPRAGKTSVGKCCAEKLQLPFFDTDALLSARFGVSPAELFGRYGRREFREREFCTLRNFLQTTDDFVLATGGGIVEHDGSLALLAAEKAVVLVTAPLSVIAERLLREQSAGKPPPRFFHNEQPTSPHSKPTADDCGAFIREQLHALFVRRDSLYTSVARYTIVNDGTVEKAAETLLSLIECGSNFKVAPLQSDFTKC